MVGVGEQDEVYHVATQSIKPLHDGILAAVGLAINYPYTTPFLLFPLQQDAVSVTDVIEGNVQQIQRLLVSCWAHPKAYSRFLPRLGHTV